MFNLRTIKKSGIDEMEDYPYAWKKRVMCVKDFSGFRGIGDTVIFEAGREYFSVHLAGAEKVQIFSSMEDHLIGKGLIAYIHLPIFVDHFEME